MALLLNDQDLAALLTMDSAIDAAETALKQFESGAGVNLPRHHFYAASGGATFFMRNFQGAVPALGVAGMRLTTDVLGAGVHRPDLRPFGAFLLFDLATAELLAIVHDHELQRLRVGAETGVAIRTLANPDAATVAVLGAGFQAETQIAAACAVRPIRRAAVFSPTTARRQSFARRMGERLAIDIEAVDSAEAAVRGKDLVLASTNASTPVLDGNWLREGAHVTSIVNSDKRYPRRELDNRTFARAKLVAIGYLEQTKHDEAADIFDAVAAGALEWTRVCQLGEILAGKRPGRTDPADITVFKNNGLAVEFVALAARAWEIARSRGAGEEIPERFFSGLRTR